MTIHWDHLEDSTLPTNLYRSIHERGGAHVISTHGGWVALTAYDLVSAAARDWRTFSSAAGIELPVPADHRPGFLAEADPPTHSRPRKLVAATLPAAADDRAEQIARHAASDVIGVCVRHAEIDGVDDIALPVVTRTLLRVIGVPATAFEPVGAHLRSAYNESGQRPDLTSLASILNEAVYAEYRGRRTDAALNRAAAVLAATLTAGHEVTVSATAELLAGLASGRYQLGRSHSTKAVIHEFLRQHAPAQIFFRTATRETKLDGVAISPGVKVGLVYGAANVDPRAWDEPESFKPGRPAKHLSFGAGVHTCPGRHLAVTILAAVLDEATHVTFEPAGEPRRAASGKPLRKLLSLPLRIEGTSPS